MSLFYAQTCLVQFFNFLKFIDESSLDGPDRGFMCNTQYSDKACSKIKYHRRVEYKQHDQNYRTRGSVNAADVAQWEHNSEDIFS